MGLDSQLSITQKVAIKRAARKEILALWGKRTRTREGLERCQRFLGICRDEGIADAEAKLAKQEDDLTLAIEGWCMVVREISGNFRVDTWLAEMLDEHGHCSQ